MSDNNEFSLTDLFVLVAVEAFVFGSLNLDAVTFGGTPHVH